MADSTPTELQFEAPGPGTWEQDAVHFPRPSTRYWAEIHPAAFHRGTSDFMAYYGTMLKSMDMQYIHGFGFRAITPVSDAEVPERFARAEQVWEQKLWRDQLREWDDTAKPNAIAKHRELQAVDPDALSDAELVDYLGRCREHHALMIAQHMRYTGAAMLSIGDLLAHVGAWTGVPHAEILGMMRGAAPVSAGAAAELQRLIDALNADDAARARLVSDGDAGEVLDALRATDGEVGEATAGYLDLVGYRLLDGFDIGGRYALELPDALVRAIRSAVEGGTGEAAADSDARIAEVRNQVPAEHQAEFDELVAEARLMYRIRDERGVFSDIWASGISRRAVMAAGRRVAAQGRVHDPEHFVDAGTDEMAALVLGTGGPAADELATRYEWRTTHSAKDAPAFLGDPPHPPPDPSGLPPGAARVMGAMGIALGALFGSSDAEHEEHLLRGLGASGGVYEGPARRVSGPAEFDRIQQGDVLVTESTTEAFNILLPLLGAIVTDSGGLLSHSAIVAREYGIPGVVGTREATERIADGTIVRVDGDAGEVTVHG